MTCGKLNPCEYVCYEETEQNERFNGGGKEVEGSVCVCVWRYIERNKS